MKTIMLVFGTRPEAIKMCPLVKELRSRSEFHTFVCVTGQHREMLAQVLDAFAVVPDFDLQIMKENQTLFDVTDAVLCKLKPVLEQVHPDIVLVHGDTTTAFAASLACYYLHIPVGHVEAGLRTGDIESPFPEEFNRQAVSLIARYHFAPTALARENLLREGKPKERIHVTGNTVIDALQTTVRADYQNEHLRWAEGSRLVLLTAHRRENIGEPMTEMFRAVRRVTEEIPDIKVIYPVHMNPVVRRFAHQAFDGCERIRLIEPLDVTDFHNFMARACLILTDSGGVQEEAPHFGVPVLVMRDTTERPEGVAAGTLRLVGTKEETICRNFLQLMTDKTAYEKMHHAVNPYGDGHASQRIADILEEK